MFRCLLVLALTFPPLALAADRPETPAGKSGRSVTIAPNGMVATSHPLAAQIGLDILKKGGNAVDAAIACNAAMGLMEPTSNGLGGDLYAIVWDPKTNQIYGLNASGRAPMKATLDYFQSKKLTQIPTKGPLSWSVPGCVGGWGAMHDKFGTVPMPDLLQPAIDYAEKGFPISEVIAGYWKANEKTLAADPGSKAIFLVEDNNRYRSPKAGELFKNPALAKTLRLIGAKGADGFYKDEVADKLVELSNRVGGLFTKEDFVKNEATWVKPVSVNYRGYTVWELPPPGQGIAALQMLNTMEMHNVKAMGPNSADYWHLFLEAKKLAFADRAKYYADPAFAKIPVDTLISKDYATKREKLIDNTSAMKNVAAGDTPISHADTIYLTVVDSNRMCVSLIQSNYMGFGSGIAHPDLGFGIQNRGCLFALDDAHANKLEPGKRPFHTIIPAMVTLNNEPWFTFGVMGGDMQPQGHVEMLVNMIDFGMNVQQAAEAPRMEHIGSATPTGLPEKPPGGVVQVESGFPPAMLAELEKRGHRIEKIRVNGGGFQGILIDPRTKMLHGGSEPRKDGMAVGY